MKLPAVAHRWQASCRSAGLERRLAGLRGSLVRTFSAMELPDPRAAALAYPGLVCVRRCARCRDANCAKTLEVILRACLGATNIRFNASENTRSKTEPQ